jgi:hypothetical protein
MCSRTPSKSGRPVCGISIGWHHIAWHPQIGRGVPVSDPVFRRPGVGWSVDAFQRHCPEAMCVSPEARVPSGGPFGILLPRVRSRIQFPTL